MKISDAVDIAATRAIHVGFGMLAVPDPIPLVDELLAAGLITAGSLWHGYNFVVDNVILPYGNVTSYPSLSQPITSTTGHSQGGHVKKQIRSTSRPSYSRRRYYYGKKRKYRY